MEMSLKEKLQNNLLKIDKRASPFKIKSYLKGKKVAIKCDRQDFTYLMQLLKNKAFWASSAKPQDFNPFYHVNKENIFIFLSIKRKNKIILTWETTSRDLLKENVFNFYNFIMQATKGDKPC